MDSDNFIILMLAIGASALIIRLIVLDFLGLSNLDNSGNPNGECKVHKWKYDIKNQMVCIQCNKRPGQ